MANNREVANRCFDETTRIGKVVWLAAQADCICDDLEEFFDDTFDRIEAVVGPIADNYKETLSDSDSILEWIGMTGKLGFLIRFDTPIRTYISDSTFSEGWGYYATDWHYGETFEEALEKGFAGVAKRRESEIREFKEGP